MTYPSDIPLCYGARIADVLPGSPADDAGLEPGMVIHTVDSQPLRDILDWHWLSDGTEIVVEVSCSGKNQAGILEETDGETVPPHRAFLGQDATAHSNDKPTYNKDQTTQDICLNRNQEESWGISFEDVLFDGLLTCVNACIFCFMRMLPEGLRPSLSARDDDYRLSFLHGNFVTLTNLSSQDMDRIIRMKLSPLNVSLHAVDSDVRAHLMGPNHARGLAALEILLQAGISFNAQIVLMPGINDGAVLERTLSWIDEHPGIEVTGIVPYGYTRYARLRHGFDTAEKAQSVIRQAEDLAPRVQLADEFYIQAWPGEVLQHLPPAQYYDGYPLLADGIGMLRNFLDTIDKGSLPSPRSVGNGEVLVTGEAFAAVLLELVPECAPFVLAIRNDFFGGNITVSGLLTAQDVIQQAAHLKGRRLILPQVMFNDDGLTLDGKTVEDISCALHAEIRVSEGADPFSVHETT